jgi:hypothetical protein
VSHTKEPWILGKNSLTVLDKETGFMIVNAYSNNLNRREDMKRIVACVNWCAGNSTEGMLRAVEIGRPYEVERDKAIERELETTKQRDAFKDAAAFHKSRADDAEKQRDELLAALEYVISDLELRASLKDDEIGEVDIGNGCYEQALAALSSVKGQQ